MRLHPRRAAAVAELVTLGFRPALHDLQLRAGFVFWAHLSDSLSRVTGVFPLPTSGHRLVAIDLEVR